MLVKLVEARLRILAIFHRAYEVRPDGSRRGTDNYVGGVGSKPSDLAKHIVAEIHNPFIEPHELEVEELSRSLGRDAVDKSMLKVVLEQINLMCSAAELWFDERCGVWQMSQSCMQSYLDQKNAVHRLVKQFKYDRRNEHGQVRSQRKNRGRPAGASCAGQYAC